MTINGKPVSRSEFEYSYNKNNADGVIDKKSVDEYVNLFINYKLKVQAALDAHLDTLSSFKKEFLSYRDQQVRPTFITDADVEAEGHKLYREAKQQVEANGGMWHCAHILIGMLQSADKEEAETVKQLADSIYIAIRGGADLQNWQRNILQMLILPRMVVSYYIFRKVRLCQSLRRRCLL